MPTKPKPSPVGPIGIRLEAAVARMWQLNTWAQNLADIDELPECFARQMNMACDELCESGTAVAEEFNVQLAGGWGGK